MNEATTRRARRTVAGGREAVFGVEEMKEKRRLTGDIDRPDRRATFGKNAPPDRRPIFFDVLRQTVRWELRLSSYRIATF